MKPDPAALFKVQNLLLKIDSNLQKADENTFTLRYGSARAFIWVNTEDDASFVTIEIPVLRDLRLTPDLLKFVAFDNSYALGHLYLEDLNGSLVMEFRHTLMVKNLTAETLTWAAIGMLKSADGDGPVLKKRFGGQLSHEG